MIFTAAIHFEHHAIRHVAARSTSSLASRSREALGIEVEIGDPDFHVSIQRLDDNGTIASLTIAMIDPDTLSCQDIDLEQLCEAQASHHATLELEAGLIRLARGEGERI